MTALNQLFKANARPGVPNTLIVVSDGKSMDDVTGPAQTLRDSGVTIFAIGVGRGIDKNELKNIATDPDEEHMFVVQKFDDLDSIIKTIKDKACQGMYEHFFNLLTFCFYLYRLLRDTTEKQLLS